MSGFCKCGIHPFNRAAIPVLSKQSDSPASLSKENEDKGTPDDPNDTDLDGVGNGSPPTTPKSTPPIVTQPPSDFSEEKVSFSRRDMKKAVMSLWTRNTLHG